VEIAILAAVVVSGAVVSVLVRRVHVEVRTLKGQSTSGQIIGEGESRRVQSMPVEERTSREQRHLDHEALREAPGGEDGGQG
jgi:hypothetical protein